mmetsp:Transcript_11898/g.13850  ORF Transcript_11898/g.13850 Transcript_11898/m.13850 type:complete len:231 (-) Transcript_11898:1322-2014(-)
MSLKRPRKDNQVHQSTAKKPLHAVNTAGQNVQNGMEKRSTYVTGLTLKMLEAIRGSKNEVYEEPKNLINSIRENGDRVCIWSIMGSSERLYRIEVEVPSKFSEGLEELVLSCSCPDAFKRRLRKKRLCKHLYACLFTLIDWEANRKTLENEKAAFRSKYNDENERTNLKEQLIVEQEKQFPGERQRLLKVFSRISADEIVGLLRRKLDENVENVSLMSTLFSARDIAEIN